MSNSGAGKWCLWGLGLWKVISLAFEIFILSLFCLAHSWMFLNSSAKDTAVWSGQLDERGIVGVFNQNRVLSCCLKVWGIYGLQHWTNAWSLYNILRDCLFIRDFTIQNYRLGAISKKINNPVTNMVWEMEFIWLARKDGMIYWIESFWKIYH